jgi:hypothetical protein
MATNLGKMQAGRHQPPWNKFETGRALRGRIILK